MDAIHTIGAYGYDADQFINALKGSGIDALVDVRRRRGMRGSQYAWANARRLQDRLAAEGVHYLHGKELAPTPEVRAIQHAADREHRAAKRQRPQLSGQFRDAYFRAILEPLDAAHTAAWLQEAGAALALFCVERSPDACHRSLIADWFRREGLVSKVIHLRP